VSPQIILNFNDNNNVIFYCV